MATPALSGVEIAARAPSSRALLVMPSHLFDTSRVPSPGALDRYDRRKSPAYLLMHEVDA